MIIECQFSETIKVVFYRLLKHFVHWQVLVNFTTAPLAFYYIPRKQSYGWEFSNKMFKNKPGTAKVGAISKAQNCKSGDPLGFLKLQLVEKYENKLKGDLWEILKNFGKTILKTGFLNSVTVPKLVKSGPLRIF